MHIAIPVWIQLLIGQGVDQCLRHGELLRRRRPLGLARLEAEPGLPHLVGPEHGRQNQHLIVHPQDRDDLTFAERHLGDGDPALLAQRVAQQPVRPGTLWLGLHVVTAIEIDGIYRSQR